MGPAVRATQEPDATDAGRTRLDIYEGHEYRIYQPRGTSWPDTMECGYEGGPETFEVQRVAAPFGAAKTLTDSGEAYSFFGAFHGDRDMEVFLACSVEEFLVAPGRTPLWRFWAVVAGSVLCGLLALVVGLTTGRRRRLRSPWLRPATLARPPGSLSIEPTGSLPLLASGPSGRSKVPSRGWYVAVAPLFVISLLSWFTVALAALSLADSYEAAVVGERGSGQVYDLSPFEVDGVDHLLYADLADPVPDPSGCAVYSEGHRLDDVPMRADRPLGVPETITNGGRTFQFVAVFRPYTHFYDPNSVSCGDGSTLLVKPSNRPQLLVYGGVATIAMAQLASAAVVIGVSVRRRKGEPATIHS